MIEKIKKNKLDRFAMENYTSRFIIGLLILVVLFQQNTISNRIEAQRTVFMPPAVINQEFWVTGNRVSESYLEYMSQFILFNLFNVTPSNAHNNGLNILTIVDPDFYPIVEENLNTQLNYLVDNQISRTFYFSKTSVKTPGVIKVEGVLKNLISDKMVERNLMAIKIKYKIENGRFWLTGIEMEKKK